MHKICIFVQERLQDRLEGRNFASVFMVLDLRLMKIGCRETINFFLLSLMQHLDCRADEGVFLFLGAALRKKAK